MNVFRSLIPQLAKQKEELVNAEKIRSPPPPPCLPYRCLPLLPPSLPWSTFHASTKCLYPLNLPWSLPKRRPLLKEEAFALRCPALPHLGANNTLFDALLAREGHRVRARTTFLTEAWRTYEGVMAVALCPFFLSCILSPRDKEKQVRTHTLSHTLSHLLSHTLANSLEHTHSHKQTHTQTNTVRRSGRKRRRRLKRRRKC